VNVPVLGQILVSFRWPLPLLPKQILPALTVHRSERPPPSA